MSDTPNHPENAPAPDGERSQAGPPAPREVSPAVEARTYITPPRPTPTAAAAAPEPQSPPQQGQQQALPPRPVGGPVGPPPGYGFGAYPPPGYGGGHGPPPGYPGVRPPFAQPPKPKRSRAPMIIGILILLFIVGPIALIGIVAAATSGSGGFDFNFFGDRIAILEVQGVIGQGETFEADTDRLAEVVRDWADNTRIRGMVLDINSPGGSVTPTWELYEAIQYFKDQGKPVYASMGETAASGGYLLAMSADEVYATKSTLTGSIGVIFSLMGYEELFRKIGLESRPIKSGEFKDIGSGTRPMTEAEKVLLDELIGNIYEQFLELVVENRLEAVRDRLAEREGIARADVTDEMVEDEIRGLCDGRIFSGEQAFETGMVDKLGYRADVVSAMKTQLGISEDTTEVMTPAPPVRGLFGMMTRVTTLLDSPTAGMPQLEYRFAM